MTFLYGELVSAAGNDCFWWRGEQVGNDPNTVITSISSPASIDLKRVPIGDIMAVHEFDIGRYYVKCDSGSVSMLNFVFGLKNFGSAKDDFNGVYRTNLPGVGVRFKSNGNWVIPGSYSYPNAPALVAKIGVIKMEVVRTGEVVNEGMADFDFELSSKAHNWEAFRVKYVGKSRVSRQSYMEGCRGEDLNVQMGKIAMQQIGEAKSRPFSLSVLCKGGPTAGNKLPVKIYFEGNSPGPGLLELTPGGAEGVGISLKTTGGLNFPFSKAKALGMDWVRTELDGERYSISAMAGYVGFSRGLIKPGVANATLTYVLEYE
ncbi:fimbrial protein [Pseudomonas aeruginosa]